MKTRQTNKKNIEFRDFLRKISKQGFYEILIHMQSNPHIYYSEITKYAKAKKILKSEASVTILLNAFTANKILNRKVAKTRPLRTTYSVTAKGTKIIKLLKNLEKALK